MQRVTLSIDGMSCGGCVKHVTTALSALPGVHVERISIGSADVVIESATASTDALVQGLAASGYTARVLPLSPNNDRHSTAVPGKSGCGCCH